METKFNSDGYAVNRFSLGDKVYITTNGQYGRIVSARYCVVEDEKGLEGVVYTVNKEIPVGFKSFRYELEDILECHLKHYKDGSNRSTSK